MEKHSWEQKNESPQIGHGPTVAMRPQPGVQQYDSEEEETAAAAGEAVAEAGTEEDSAAAPDEADGSTLLSPWSDSAGD